MTSKNIRKIAEAFRKTAAEIKLAKDVKCAKLIVGATALVQLRNKMKKV